MSTRVAIVSGEVPAASYNNKPRILKPGDYEVVDVSNPIPGCVYVVSRSGYVWHTAVADPRISIEHRS